VVDASPNCDIFINIPDATTVGTCTTIITNNFNGGGADASDTYPVGVTTVGFTAIYPPNGFDNQNDSNICSMTVTVTESTPPIIDCSGLINPLVQANDPGICGAQIELIPPTATANCGPPPVITNDFSNTADGSGNFAWVKQIAADQNLFLINLARDLAGNLYSTGTFSGTVDMNPNPDPDSTFEMTALGTDMFIQKLDESGNFIWAKQIKNSGSFWMGAFSVDNLGNIYIGGGFKGNNVDFDPAAGGTGSILNSTNLNAVDGFILKLNSDGIYQWVKQIAGTSANQVRGIAVDATGNVFLTGHFNQLLSGDIAGPADFNYIDNPGVNVFTSNGDSDFFIQKLNASGAYQWVIPIGGPFGDTGIGIALDADNNIYTTGAFRDIVDFDPSAGEFKLIANGSSSFIYKLNTSGNLVWVKMIVGASTAFSYGEDIAVDALQNVYTTGAFKQTADFNPDDGIVLNLTSIGETDSYIQKLNPDGSFAWVNQIGGPGRDETSIIKLDPSDSYVYVDGFFSNNANFTLPNGVNELTSEGEFDGFIQKIDANNGTTLWVKQIGGSSGNDSFWATLDIDAANNVFAGGFFWENANFDLPGGVEELNGISYDGFVMKYDNIATFPVGTTTVTWTATDASGNEDQCTQTVTINDNEAPVMECFDNIETYLDKSQYCQNIPLPGLRCR
jgi:hypothetical protein